MTRSISPAIVVLLIVGAGLGAQPHPGDALSVTSSGFLYRTPRAGGSVTTLADLGGSTGHGLALDHDNATVLLTRSTAGIFSYDPVAMAITTIYGSTLYFHHEILVNQDGDIVFTGYDRVSSPRDYGIFKLAGGKVSTIITSVKLGTAAAFEAGLEVNINTGNYLVGEGSFDYGIYDVADDGTARTLTTLAYNRYSIAQDLSNGDIYSTAFTRIVRLQGGVPNGTITTLTPPGGSNLYWYAIETERASAPKTLIWARYPTRIFHYDPVAKTLTSFVTPSAIGTDYELVFEGQRNLATVKTAPGQWTVRINFPGEAGNTYVVGISLTGYKPNLVLGDGRRICLAPDFFTVLSVTGGLAPFFAPGPFILDAQARANASLDVSGLPSLGGVPVWMCALTLKQGTIVSISDPIVVKLP